MGKIQMDVGEPNQIGDASPPDWHEATPRLRGDLVFSPHSAAGRRGYVIEDRSRGKFFRLGLAEYAFVASLDGETTLSTAMDRARQADPLERFADREAAMLCTWLANEQLLLPTSAGAGQQLRQLAQKAAQHRRATWCNPLMLRLPLVHPDGAITRIAPFLQWFVSGWMAMLTGVLVLVAAMRLAMSGEEFLGSLAGVFDPVGQLQLLLVWLALKVVHELAHAITCKKYGAEVREAGVLLLLFMPITFVDVTSSWRIRNKSARIHIAAAGILCELLIASLAALVWVALPPGALRQLAANIVLMASVATIVFNANPLMRFDGYYILTDLLEIPNLYALAQQWTRYVFRRYLAGLPTPLPAWPPGRGGMVRVYAVAALIWRWFVYAGLLTAAAVLWHGVGLVLALLAAVLWFGLPLFKLVRFCAVGSGGVRPNRLRLALVTAAVCGLMVGGLFSLPWPGARRLHGVVRYPPQSLLRAASDGFVEEVYVVSGQAVTTGDVLLRLRNDSLALDAARLDLQFQRSELVLQGLRKRGELAALDVELERQRSLTKQREELTRQIEQLTLRAPLDGTIVSPRAQSLQGTFVRAGEELLIVGNEAQKRIELAVGQEDLDRVSQHLGESVTIATRSGNNARGQLERISPRATQRPIDPALSALYGGPLTVARAENAQRGTADDGARLLVPHFTATTSLSSQQSLRLWAGQRVVVYYAAPRASLGGHLTQACRAWLETRLRPSG